MPTMHLPAIAAAVSPPPSPHSGLAAPGKPDPANTPTIKLPAKSAPAKILTDSAETQSTQPAETRARADTRKSKNGDLSNEERRQIAQLQSRDREVRAHEAAHIAAAGGLVRGGASYSYQQGPDGRRYAIGGEVSIDTSPVKDNPEATILKALKIQAAALAPAQPSGADRAVATAASQLAAVARAEVAAKKYAGDPAEVKQTETQKNKIKVDNATSETASGTLGKRFEKSATSYQNITNAALPSDYIGNLLNTAV